MKRTLIPIVKKDFAVEFPLGKGKKKKLISLGGLFYCETCGYKMVPQVETEGIGPRKHAKFYLDVSCLCNQM